MPGPNRPTLVPILLALPVVWAAACAVSAFLVLGGFGSAAWSSSFSGLGYWGVVLAAVAGAAAVMAIVTLVALRVSAGVNLLIIGLMIGSMTGAVVAVLQFFTEPELLQSFLLWSFGSVAGIGWAKLAVLAPLVILGLLLSCAWTKSLDALLVGETHARSLGVSASGARLRILISTSILSGAVTAFCGPVGFIGLAVPHLARMLFASADHRILMPGSMLAGAALLLVCDLISKTLALPINTVTALMGIPVVIIVVVRNRNLF